MPTVTLLGTAQDGGRPQPGCRQSCCQGLEPADVRYPVSLGITETHFIDDLFTPNSQWVLKFCDAIERRGLKFNWGY